LFRPTSFPAVTVVAEGYCCTRSHSVGLLRRTDRPLTETST
jgi:hypothetical protein